jgi:hypothetical protein
MKKKMSKSVEVNVERQKEKNMDAIAAMEFGREEIIKSAKMQDAELEAFNNEILKIRVASSSIDRAPIPIPVNDLDVWIPRGKTVSVKRKYVEALARARSFVYEQENDTGRPDGYRMVEREVMSYPFEIIHDPNPKGREWLERLVA